MDLKDSFDVGVQRKKSRMILSFLATLAVWMVVLFPGIGPKKTMWRDKGGGELSFGVIKVNMMR